LFCGAVIQSAPLRVLATGADEGVDDEQWYAAHRACFVQHMSKDEVEPRFSMD